MAVISTASLTPGTRPLAGLPKRGLRAAFLNLPYVGPVLSRAATEGPSSITHAVMGDPDTSEAGGAAGTTGSRESDTYSPIGAAAEIEDVGLSTADAAADAGAGVNADTRPTGRLAFTADGVLGGSEPGAVIDATGRAVSTGVDRFGRTKGVANAGAGLGTYDYTTFTGTTTKSGDGHRALGGAGRGTTVDVETVTVNKGAPTIDNTTASDGVIAIIDGTGQEIDIDIDNADLSGGANGFVGADVAVFKRDADNTARDGALVAFIRATGASGDTVKTGAVTGLTSGATYALYARRLYAVAGGGRTVYGATPWSERDTLQIA